MVAHPAGGHKVISIHALREEGDPALLIWDTMNFYFYPRPPRGGRRIAMSDLNLRIAISIHALREEGDPRSH